jgi:nitroreductase
MGPSDTEDVLARCVQDATLAPSIHNTQPWLFGVGDASVDVYADLSRALPVVDPGGAI